MKKMFIFLALLSVTIGTISAQDFSPNKRLKSGIWLKMGYDATFSNFLSTNETLIGYNGYDVGSSAADYGLDFQFGTTFYIGPRIANKLRFGLDVAWLDFSYFKLNSNYGTNGMDFFFNFFELGPKISFSPVSSIAFDLYGRIVPSFSLMTNDFASGTSTSTSTTTSFGYNTTCLIGASFRVKVFVVGVEYNLGKMAYTDTNTDDNATKSPKLITNNLRILLGFKF
jgi:hypothetical protein